MTFIYDYLWNLTFLFCFLKCKLDFSESGIIFILNLYKLLSTRSKDSWKKCDVFNYYIKTNFSKNYLLIIFFSIKNQIFSILGPASRTERQQSIFCHKVFKERCRFGRWWCWKHHDWEESACTRNSTPIHVQVILHFSD